MRFDKLIKSHRKIKFLRVLGIVSSPKMKKNHTVLPNSHFFTRICVIIHEISHFFALIHKKYSNFFAFFAGKKKRFRQKVKDCFACFALTFCFFNFE
jgi:hypothetical protein